MAGRAAHEPIPVPGREHAVPVTSYRCPVHGCLVGLDGDGRPVTCCPGCLEEAAEGIRLIERQGLDRLLIERAAAVKA